jgi:flagellin-specific chaperone FliS
MRHIALLVGFVFSAFQLPVLGSQTQVSHRSVASASAGPREDISIWASKMLEETNRARLAIKNKNEQRAVEDVDRAEADLKRVQSEAQGSTMVPVYQEFVSISFLTPIRAEQNARIAASHAGASSAKPAAVQQVAGSYTDVVVNTTVAKNNLAMAKSALGRGDLGTADAALADVQEGVKTEATEANMPLARVRENLILARSAVRHNNFTEAKVSLEAASNALATYERSGGAHAADAKTLQQQIDSYAPNIQQNHSDAVTKINKWWNTTADWTPYKND